MESHFRNEDRQLLTVLETLELDADVGSVLAMVKVDQSTASVATTPPIFQDIAHRGACGKPQGRSHTCPS